MQGGYDEEICSKMECYMPQIGKCESGAVLRAFDGTSCGNGKWCSKGRCEQNQYAPSTTKG